MAAERLLTATDVVATTVKKPVLGAAGHVRDAGRFMRDADNPNRILFELERRLERAPIDRQRWLPNPIVAASTAEKMQSRSDELIEELASRLHEVWRRPRLLADGRYEPRIKTTSDAGWTTRHGTDTVDIANCFYRELPREFKSENLESARVGVSSVLEELRAGRDPAHPDFVEYASRQVHDAWLDRNGSWAPWNQKLPYRWLSEEEKQKDRVIVYAARELISEYFRSPAA
ncbi:hypothetical protein [Nocardia australiensis]|uniref:hypothetical protein n=1 Tax=Nocardia australiensis TaxID=2887191 RepID=UPI001D142372|nr:hypothetical protein [Nocardia australiensis]